MNLFLLFLAIIPAVQPPATLPGIPEQISRNGFYYEHVEGMWPPVTFIFGPWETLHDVELGIRSRPAKARVAVVCPGRSTHCTPVSTYIEVKVFTYGPEYQHHSQDLLIDYDARQWKPFTYTASQVVGMTRDLPSNWIPGDKNSPQLSVVAYTSGAEFPAKPYYMTPSNGQDEGSQEYAAVDKLLAPLSMLCLGEWCTSTSPLLLTDLKTLSAEAIASIPKPKGRRKHVK